MLHDVVLHFKMNPLLIIYDDEEEIILWKDFIETEMRTNLVPPKFVRIVTTEDQQRNL
jgi:hypothetical protein